MFSCSNDELWLKKTDGKIDTSPDIKYIFQDSFKGNTYRN